MTVHSVSDVTRYIKGMFEGEEILSDILIRGEVSNFKRYPSGHCYFTLKDADASMKCVMFNGYVRNLCFSPENGMQVIAGGSVSVYERDGVYQLYVNTLTPEGAGSLALAFEQQRGFSTKRTSSPCRAFRVVSGLSPHPPELFCETFTRLQSVAGRRCS